jgi:hypothetical protein
MTDDEKLNSILRHIKRVEDNCNLLARKLMKENPEFALEMVRRGRDHDRSKLSPYQFECLWPDHPNFKAALDFHRSIESHHPEYYSSGVRGGGGIYDMTEGDFAEMVCDCLARAQEFGTDIHDWFFKDEFAPTKYDYKGDKSIYEKIEKYLNLLLTPTFTTK